MRIQKENQVIYVFVNKQKKTFFITHGTEKTLRETYRHHIKMRRNLSAKFISNCGSIRPCLFVLECINPEEKINLMLIWLRILRENGFESSNHPNLIEMSEDLYFDNKIAYEKRKDIDLTSIFSCEKCLVPFLKKTPCANNPALEKQNKPIVATSHPVDDSRTQINLRLSTKEHEHIRKMAKEHSIPMNHYVKNAAMHPNIIHVDYSDIAEHTEQIKKIRTAINRHIFTIEAMGSYHPRDIEAILYLMEDALTSQKELVKKVKKRLR